MTKYYFFKSGLSKNLDDTADDQIKLSSIEDCTIPSTESEFELIHFNLLLSLRFFYKKFSFLKKTKICACNAEAHCESCQTSKMKFFCEKQLTTLNC